jgi:hypothetical protein
MSTIALIRPHDWTIPLFIHVFGAMLLVGALTLSAVSLIAAWRSGSAALTRLGFMSIFYGAIPGWVVMRVGAAWIANKEGLDSDKVKLSWLDVGFTTADGGFVLLIALLIIGGNLVRRINRDESGPWISARIATGMVSLLLIGYLVAVWAMTTKPA